jgi:NMD protein affecting ribosome stability and mRNA decay
MLAKARTVCVFCGRNDELAEHRGRTVCRPCIGELAEAAS